MNFNATCLPYRQTNAFTSLVLDYIDQSPALDPFYQHKLSIQGIEAAIKQRDQFNTDRSILLAHLQAQYRGTEVSEKVSSNIQKLAAANTFTITTAHQNNLFTGPLYFIYKVLHAIKLSAHLNSLYTDKHFVPVFYMGSEDADLEELNHIYINNEKLAWNTKQTGAVGRMLIDKELVTLIDKMHGQLSVWPHGEEIIGQLRKFYKVGTTIADASFQFLNSLFGEYGLVVLQPDSASLKSLMKPVFEDDLMNQTASSVVEITATDLEEAGYKVQANPREINLFYLEGDQRNRLEKIIDEWKVLNRFTKFNKQQLLDELNEHPERFSPNVILRGLYQETILPNVAFIGGGGETAYWLQLKDLFNHYKVPFPVLVLRNSFMLVEAEWADKMEKLGFDPEDLFQEEQDLMNKLVRRETKLPIDLSASKQELEDLYDRFLAQASAIDPTLGNHVAALKTVAVNKIRELEKKMLRAERRKFSDQQRQLHHLKQQLFPNHGLQERRENICYYYAKWGREFIHALYDASLNLEQEFVVMRETSATSSSNKSQT